MCSNNNSKVEVEDMEHERMDNIAEQLEPQLEHHTESGISVCVQTE